MRTRICLAVLLSCSLLQAADPKLEHRVVPQEDVVSEDGKLWVVAVIQNAGTEPVTVYWGDYALPSVYSFDIRHVKSGRRVIPFRSPVTFTGSPKIGNEKYFRTIKPQGFARYTMLLSPIPGANAQYTFFREPGEYEIKPTLHLNAKWMLNQQTGEVTESHNAWTGTLTSKPFRVTFKPGPHPEASAVIRGRITDHNGKPVDGARVQLNQRRPSNQIKGMLYDQPADVAVSNEDGWYQFHRVDPAWGYRLLVYTRESPMKSIVIPDDGSLSRPDAEFSIQLSRPVPVHGRIVDGANRPVPWVRVDHNTYSDADGQFSVLRSADAEQFRIGLWKIGYETPYPSISPQEYQARASEPWTIRIWRKDELKLTGTAKFADGRPVAHRKFRIALIPLNEVSQHSRYERSGTTTAEGQFSVSLPTDGKYRAEASFFEKNPSGIGRVWSVDAGRVQPGSRVDLTAEDRGSILVGVGRPNVPEGFSLAISCTDSDSHRTLIQVTPEGTRGGVRLDGLPPGRYTVTVRVPNLTYESWSAPVEIPRELPMRGRVTVRVPELQLGHVKAQFLMPDGRTPAARVALFLEGVGSSRSVSTDENGQLVVKHLVAGRLSIMPSRHAGLAEVSHGSFTVVAKETVDLGKIRLRSVDEEFGQFAGTLRYDDGTAIPATFSQQTMGLTEGGFWGGTRLRKIDALTPKENSVFECAKGIGRPYFSYDHGGNQDPDSQCRRIRRSLLRL